MGAVIWDPAYRASWRGGGTPAERGPVMDSSALRGCRGGGSHLIEQPYPEGGAEGETICNVGAPSTKLRMLPRAGRLKHLPHPASGSPSESWKRFPGPTLPAHPRRSEPGYSRQGRSRLGFPPPGGAPAASGARGEGSGLNPELRITFSAFISQVLAPTLPYAQITKCVANSFTFGAQEKSVLGPPTSSLP